MARRKVGKISDGTWIALAGGAVVLYLVTRPKAPALPYPGYPAGYPGTYPPGYYPPVAGGNNNTAAAIATGVSSIFNTIFG